MSELVSLREEKKFKPRPQNKFLVSLRDSLQNFPRDPRPFYFGVGPFLSSGIRVFLGMTLLRKQTARKSFSIFFFSEKILVLA